MVSQPDSLSQRLDPEPGRRPIGYLTSAQFRTGGILKQDPEDFVVEELPAYEPAGEGEHLFLWVEKRDVSGEQLLDILARGLQIDRGDIGCAGLKDRRAVTRQWISVPARCADRVATLDAPGVRVMKQQVHRNKLRTGHLRGNRFEIHLREVLPGSEGAAEEIAGELRRSGVPNLYGDQRFGIEKQTLSLGLALLRGEKSPRAIPFQRRKFLLRLSLSAVQSALFNDVLAARLEWGTLRQVLPGEVLQVTASGGCFLSDDPAAEQARLERGEIMTTGPMFGPTMKAPTGDAEKLERDILEAWQLQREMFERFKDLTSGTRRALLAPLNDLSIQADGDSLRLQFSLPSGAYATSVIREFQKA